MEEQQSIPTPSVEAPSTPAIQVAVEANTKRKRSYRSRKKDVAPEVKQEKQEEHLFDIDTEDDAPTVNNPIEDNTLPSASESITHLPKEEKNDSSEKASTDKNAVKPIPKMPTNLVIRDFCDLANAASRIPLLSDQQIQTLPYKEAYERNLILEAILSNVLDYDVVLSDTNIWLELLVGHTSTHSDPKVNARLTFERQLEFISKMCKKIGGKFMIMSETYEEVDRFATMQEPTDYKLADWKDEALCRNVAARLAKRLILGQQKENRLRIEGIGSESHHGSFADPAIIRRIVELFAEGKKVLLLTNDASVAIRSLGMCDDLQRTNKISDRDWRTIYEPQRPMVLTMDDLKVLDQFTRQYHFLLVAAGRAWMQDVPMREPAVIEKPLELWLEGFRPGDRHDRRTNDKNEATKDKDARKEQDQQRQQDKQTRREEQERREQQKQEQQRQDQQRQDQQRQDQQRREQRQRQEQERQDARREQERREQQSRLDKERAAAEKAARLAAEESQRQAEAAAEPAPVSYVAPDNDEEDLPLYPDTFEPVVPESMPQPQATAEPESPAAEPASDPDVYTPEVSADVMPEEIQLVVESPTELAQPVSLPPLSAEARELIGGSASAEKKRTRRGGRRRKPEAPATA